MRNTVFKRLIPLFLCFVMLCPMIGAIAEGGKAERHYVEPVFTKNDNGPVIGVTVKQAIEQDGKHYRDANGNGTLEPYENWALTPEERAKDLVGRMSPEEKIGLMVINSRGMGINVKDQSQTAMDGLLDETTDLKDTSIFGTTSKLGTVDTIKTLHLRHFILRQNPTPADMTKWINAMNQVAEETEHGIPVLVDSNSRNENGKLTFGMNDAAGVFSTWPGTLGLAAAAMGDIKAGGTAQLISDFADISRGEWDACGIKKGYMYMADVTTDPRWQRTYGTLGERPEFIADAIGRLVEGFQGSSEGVTPEGIALTVKHFPGGGARENGFDPHYELGQWNPYPTKGSLEKFHLPPFQAAIDKKVSSIMPYYAKPYAQKSAEQAYKGKTLDLSEPVGFAFNKAFIKTLLREQMGHTGYINSDSGIIGRMAWGMSDFDVPTRAAYAINAGTDMISDTNDVWSIKEAYRRGVEEKDKYAAEHVLSIERIDEAAGRLLKEMFALGLFENPYRNPEAAEETVKTARADARVAQAHHKSVVLLKNTDNTLPLSDNKLEGKTVYIEYFNQKGDGENMTKELRNELLNRGMTVVGDYNKADYALLFCDPLSGNYFSATKGYLELDICENKEVAEVGENGAPIDSKHSETTMTGTAKIAEIAKAVHARGGKVISNVNCQLAWMMGNVEPHVDALLVGFDTFAGATLDIITGVAAPSGVLPLTLPKDDSVIAVNENADCISPNDVPGYAKDEYMPDSMKDENGKAYAYRDSEGNYYESNFGLNFK